MTKTEKLEKKVAELEAKLAEAGIQTEPTKMEQIVALETDTLDAINVLVKNCEAKTGRFLQDRKSVTGDIELRVEDCDTLKQYLRDLGGIVRERYTFDSASDFSRWAKPYLRSGFSNKKKF